MKSKVYQNIIGYKAYIFQKYKLDCEEFIRSDYTETPVFSTMRDLHLHIDALQVQNKCIISTIVVEDVPYSKTRNDDC